MSEFFQFERDFVESLRCIPMQVRYKLDTCGVKLKLHHWHNLTADDRRLLVSAPCTTEAQIASYRDTLRQLVNDRTGETPKDLAIDPDPPWHLPSLPDSVCQKAAEFDIQLQPEQWQTLTPLQRFALIKLSRSGHENKNFLPAIVEFGLR